MLPEQGKIKAIEEMEERSQGLCNLCTNTISDLKLSGPAWDELITRANKLHTHTRNFVVSYGSFVDSFQRIADIATKSSGGVGDTKDIGATLTRICLRQRSVESKLKSMDRIFNENVLCKLNQEVSDWKRNVANLDKEYGKNLKEYKKRRSELKKKVSANLKMHSKIVQQDPREPKNRDIQRRVNEVFEELSGYYATSAERHKQSLRSALVEERSQFCSFSNYMRPYFDMQVSISDELSRMNELLKALDRQTENPDVTVAELEDRVFSNTIHKNNCNDSKALFGKGAAKTRPFGAIESLSRCTRAISDRRKCSSPSITSLFSIVSNKRPTSVVENGQMTLTEQTSSRITNEVQSLSKESYQYDCLKSGLYNLSRDSGFTSQDRVYSSSSKTAYSLCINKHTSIPSNNIPNISHCVYRKHAIGGDGPRNNSKRPLLNSKLFYPPITMLHRDDESLDSFDVTMEADQTTVPDNKADHNGESLTCLPLPPSNFFDETTVSTMLMGNEHSKLSFSKESDRVDYIIHGQDNNFTANDCHNCPIYESTQSTTYDDTQYRLSKQCSRKESFLSTYSTNAASIARMSLAPSHLKRNPLLAEIERGVQLRKVKVPSVLE